MAEPRYCSAVLATGTVWLSSAELTPQRSLGSTILSETTGERWGVTEAKQEASLFKKYDF
jgi:hypothetical protein